MAAVQVLPGAGVHSVCVCLSLPNAAVRCQASLQVLPGAGVLSLPNAAVRCPASLQVLPPVRGVGWGGGV